MKRRDLNNRRVPIDKGYAWLVALLSMCVWMVSSTCMVGFSVYYVEFLSRFNAGESVTSSIFSVYMITYSISGPFSGEVINALGFRVNGCIGCLLGCIGLLICCFSEDIVFIFLGYGVCVGAGGSFMQITAMVSTQMYFYKWRSVAMGFAGIGVSVSGFIVPLLVRYLVDAYSLKGSLLIMAGVFLQALPLVCLIRPIPKPTSISIISQDSKELDTRPQRARCAVSVCKRISTFVLRVFNVSLLKEPKVFLYYIGMFCTNMYTTTVYSFTVARGISNGQSKFEAALSMTIFGATNMVGRIFVSWLGDKFGRFACLCTCALLTGVASILSTFYFTHTLYVIFCAFTGFTVGGYIILAITTCVDIVGIDKISKTNGLISLFFGFAGMLAMSIGGMIVEATGSYDIIFLVIGVVILVGGTILTSLAITLRITRKRKQQMISITTKSPHTKKKKVPTATLR